MLSINKLIAIIAVLSFLDRDIVFYPRKLKNIIGTYITQNQNATKKVKEQANSDSLIPITSWEPKMLHSAQSTRNLNASLGHTLLKTKTNVDG